MTRGSLLVSAMALLSVAATLVLPGAGAAGPAVTLLLHHPDDGVDPFGFPFQGSDAFTVRYTHLAAQAGRFDYPFFVADGVLPIAALPDPEQPYLSVREAYGNAVAVRSIEAVPLVLRLSSSLSGDLISVQVEAEPRAELVGEDLHVWVALAEDPVRYQPPSGLTNGIIDHRFTVRALADLGRLDFANGTASADWSAPHASGWAVDRLIVAAWIQQDAPSPRFDAREVVQATHAALGAQVVQDGKGVLAEVLSATWCDPCLYGDRAAEDLAIALGAAQPLEAPRTRYLEAPAHPWFVVGLSVAAGLAVATLGRRGRGRGPA